MQTEQPVAEGPELKEALKVHVPLFSAEDVEKKRSRKFVEGKGEIPNDKLAAALDLWVESEGWLNQDNISLVLIIQIDPQWTAFDISQVAYRWGYMKRMLPPEQWKPGWGRRPRKAKVEPVPQSTLNSDPPPELVDQVVQLLKDVRRIDSTNKQLGDTLEYLRQTATPASMLSDEVVRLAGVVDHERTGATLLLERIIKIENKLRGGGRKSPLLLTKLHREVRRRLRILIAGGK